MYSENEMLDEINKHNGLIRVGVSVYNYAEKGRDDLVKVGKLFFDIDNENISAARKLHNFLLCSNVKHCIFFSGGGFHFYVKTKEYENLQNKKEALRAAQNFIALKAGLTWAMNGNNGDLDVAVRGNLAQIATAPNTWNVKRKLYCIPLTIEDLKKGLKHIKERAQKQQFDFVSFGALGVDLSAFDAPPNTNTLNPPNPHYLNPKKIELKILPPCLQKALKSEKCGNRERYRVLCFLREKNIAMQSTLDFLQEHLSASEFGHMVSHEGQPQAVYGGTEFFAACTGDRKCCKQAEGLYL